MANTFSLCSIQKNGYIYLLLSYVNYYLIPLTMAIKCVSYLCIFSHTLEIEILKMYYMLPKVVVTEYKTSSI